MAVRIRPLLMNALSLMLTRRYRAGGGTLHSFGSHRIRHATATLLVNNGMPLEEVSRYLGHSSTDVTRRYARQTPDALGRRAAEALGAGGRDVELRSCHGRSQVTQVTSAFSSIEADRRCSPARVRSHAARGRTAPSRHLAAATVTSTDS